MFSLHAENIHDLVHTVISASKPLFGRTAIGNHHFDLNRCSVFDTVGDGVIAIIEFSGLDELPAGLKERTSCAMTRVPSV